MTPTIDLPHAGAEFFLKPGDDWKKPAILTLAIHLLTVILALLPASIFEPNLNLEEIYTVDLFDVMETRPVQQSAPPPPPVVKQEVIKQPPPQTKPLMSEAPAPEITSGPVEVISLTPRLVKKDLREKNKAAARQEKKKLSKALEKIQSRVKADQEAEKAQESAKAAVKDALTQLRASIHTSQARTVADSKVGGVSGGPGSQGQTSGMNAALKQYYVAVSRQIHKFWILPDLQEWEKQLTAVYVVHVRRDGIVKNGYMEKKSADLYFNQFVEKTMQEALPLPPFPAGLKEKELEIGLVFHPSGLE